VGAKRSLETVSSESATKRLKNRNENHLPRSPLAEAVVNGQRVSRSWNEAWKLWVTLQPYTGRHKTPPCDPARWSPEQLKIFFDELAQCYMELRGKRYSPDVRQRFGESHIRSPGGFDPYMQQFEQPIGRSRQPWERELAPPQNLDIQTGFGIRMRGFTDPLLIQFVKDGQRNSQSFRDFWSQHCQEHGGGTFDPRKHATPFFVGSALCYGVERLVQEEWAKPYLGAIGLAGQPLLGRVIKNGLKNELKESWASFCEQKGETRKDPILFDPQTLFEFMGSVGMDTYKVPELLEKLAEIT